MSDSIITEDFYLEELETVNEKSENIKDKVNKEKSKRWPKCFSSSIFRKKKNKSILSSDENSNNFPSLRENKCN